MSEQLKQSNSPRTTNSLSYPFYEMGPKMSNKLLPGEQTECATPVNSKIGIHNDFLLLKLRALDDTLMPDECKLIIESNEESDFLYYPPNSPDFTYKKSQSNISLLILE